MSRFGETLGLKKMRKMVLISAALGALAMAGAANATQYLLNVNQCSTPGCIASPATSAGTIDVSSISGGLHFDIQLATNIFFNQAGQGHDTFGMDLSGDPTVTFQNFMQTNLFGATSDGDGNFAKDLNTHPDSFDPAPFSESGTPSIYNGLGYGFDWIGSPTNNGSLVPTAGLKRLTFDVIGSPLTVVPTTGTPPIYFTVDVARYDPTSQKVVATGLVGATLVPGGVPEPASWALMILGFGGVGAVLRRRRQGQAALTA
jgi:hypothetical protein